MRMRGDIRRIAAMWAGSVLAGLATAPSSNQPTVPDRVVQQEAPRSPIIYIDAYVTGYNTVVGQTDKTPCIGALGTNICGRRNVVACPPMLPLGTMVEIKGKTYICEDRMAAKFRDRFDINCDQDKRCPYRVAGWESIRILLD
jgi:3D (Asp-Asp-Asp) domain-containing protein